MKTALSLLCSALISLTVLAQKSDIDKGGKTKKIETIKIIDGDTVFHDVRMVSEDDVERRMRKREHYSEVDIEVDEEIDEILKNMDIYVNVDDAKKKMIVKHLSIQDEDMEDILEQLKKDEDLILDMRDGRESVKVIKIEIDNENGEEIKVVKMQKGMHGHDKGKHGERGRKGGPSGMKGGSDGPQQGLNVFPNPASDELNVEFGVPKGSETQLLITNMEGKQLFNKTYSQSGFQKETIKLDNKEEGFYIVSLKDGRRNITKKIIIE